MALKARTLLMGPAAMVQPDTPGRHSAGDEALQFNLGLPSETLRPLHRAGGRRDGTEEHAQVLVTITVSRSGTASWTCTNFLTRHEK